MNFQTWAEIRLKRLDWIDLGPIKLICLIFGILLATFIPVLATVNVWLLVLVLVLLVIQPLLKVLG